MENVTAPGVAPLAASKALGIVSTIGWAVAAAPTFTSTLFFIFAVAKGTLAAVSTLFVAASDVIVRAAEGLLPVAVIVVIAAAARKISSEAVRVMTSVFASAVVGVNVTTRSPAVAAAVPTIWLLRVALVQVTAVPITLA